MKNPFLVNISAIRGRPESRQELNVSRTMDELVVTGSRIPVDSAVSFEGAIEAMEAGVGVVAVGHVRARWVGDCRRCLSLAAGEIDEPVREIYVPDAVEGETYPIEGDNLDLEPLIRETVMLELPEAPVCKPECAGLCDTCGVNLNENSDHAHEAAPDPRWAALDVLKVDSEDQPG